MIRLIAFIIAATFTACHAAPDEKGPQRTSFYGFSIQLPAGWHVFPDNSSAPMIPGYVNITKLVPTVSETFNPPKEEAAMFAIEVKRVAADFTADFALGHLATALDQAGCKVIPQKPVTVDGIEIQHLTSLTHSRQGTLRFDQYILSIPFGSGRLCYLFLLESSALRNGEVVTREPTMKAMMDAIQTIKLTPPASPPSAPNK